MNTKTYSSVRAHLAETLKTVCEDHEPCIITRKKAEPVVLVSLADFKSMEETAYLLKSPMNAARLGDAIDEIESMIVKPKARRVKRKK